MRPAFGVAAVLSWAALGGGAVFGVALAGWVGSVVDPAFASDSARFAANVALLERALPAPCLGLIPYLVQADAATAQRFIFLDTLLTPTAQEATP